MIRFLIYFLILINSCFAFGQNVTVMKDTNTTTIFFYRKKQFTGFGSNIGIRINSDTVETLKVGKRLIVKVKAGDSLTISAFDRFSKTKSYNEIKIDSMADEEYFIETNWDKIYDKNRPNKLQIQGLGIYLILKDTKSGSADFKNNGFYKDNIDKIKTINWP